MKKRIRLHICAAAVAAAAALVIVTGAAGAGNAGYTTYIDQTKCLGGSIVNCNLYAAKTDVYTRGGPTSGAGLNDGQYYFAVLNPGFQNGGFIDGADGNLSDATASHDSQGNPLYTGAGGGDAVGNRTFTVSGGKITSYSGTHGECDSATGALVNPCPVATDQGLMVQLAPFDDTTNGGGVYILAICKVGATSPSDCKFDAFKVAAGAPCLLDCGPQELGVISGEKYYDANHNGQLDPGELGIANWPLTYDDGAPHAFSTAADGTFTLTGLSFGLYLFEEVQSPVPAWTQTGNTVNQSSATSPSSVLLLPDKSYVVDLETDTVSGLNFGNVCTVGNTHGLTLGFWSNKNGQAILTAHPGWAAAISALHLVGPTSPKKTLPWIYRTFTSGQYADFRTWILNATATNASYMLSAQLAATELNVLYNGQDTTVLVKVVLETSPGVFVTTWEPLSQVIAEATSFLGSHLDTTAAGVNRDNALMYKDIFDGLNNNALSVTPGTSDGCPNPFPVS